MVDGPKTNTDDTVPALKKGLQILEMVSVRQRTLTIGEVAGRNAYALGSMVLSRGFCYLASRDILSTVLGIASGPWTNVNAYQTKASGS